MKRQNQAGFAHAGAVLLLVIVLAVLGGGGYYVWHKNHEQKSASDLGTSQNSHSTNPPQNTSTIKDVTLQNSHLKFSYDNSVWNVDVAENSRVDQTCGKQDNMVLSYKNSAFVLPVSLGACGKGGGVCFDEPNSACVTESKVLATVELSSTATKYVVAHRTSTDGGKTWSYEVGLNDQKACGSLCTFTVMDFESNPGEFSGRYEGEGELPGNPQSLAEFAKLPEVQATIKLLETLKY